MNNHTVPQVGIDDARGVVDVLAQQTDRGLQGRSCGSLDELDRGGHPRFGELALAGRTAAGTRA